MVMVKTRRAYTALQKALGEVKTLSEAYGREMRESKTPDVRILAENLNLSVVENKIKDAIEYYKNNIEIT